MTRETTDFKYNNGDQAKSIITDFKGTITARADHLYGCNRYMLQPKIKDGAMQDAFWHDEDELVITKAKVFKRKNNDRGGSPDKLK